MSSAQQMWVRYVQRQAYGQQFVNLQAKKNDAIVNQLQLYLQNENLMCQGRFAKATSNNSLVLLPEANKLTDLIIQSVHVQLYHQGIRHTLSALRETYWIPQGRQQVKTILGRCVVCYNGSWNGLSYKPPISPDLPSERVTISPPFTYTGCDFAGPVFTFNGNNEAHKSYICLFTCAVTRAIHLKLVRDLSTESFLLALKRFISRRGTPNVINSDHAATLKLAASTIGKIFSAIVKGKDVVNFVSTKGDNWKFNVERGPWWGGYFERMVELVKRTIVKSVGKTKLTHDSMATLLTEVKAILNTRPITYVYDNAKEGKPLTPACFLSEARTFGFPSPKFKVEDPTYGPANSTSTELLSRYKKRQNLVDRYWQIWLKEYLVNLREFHQVHKFKKGSSYPPNVGDVVLIKEEAAKRSTWKVGVITALLKNKSDGQVRAAQVRCNKNLLQRPITNLYPLEVKSDAENLSNSNNIPVCSGKVLRKAAEETLKKIKTIQTLDEE